jgi:UDP-N-acetylmuramate: L-alanyl-gamma-D-glutamyl-meso-diaminopimelate ligase
MEITPEALYQKNSDKQRIVIVGEERNELLTIVVSVLKLYNRKFDLFSKGKLIEQLGSPSIIIEASENLNGYHHHMGVVTPSCSTSPVDIIQFVNATPKGGTLLYWEGDAKIKSLVTKEMTDVQVIQYKVMSHQLKDGLTTLISSTNEKFPIKLTGNKNLLLLSLAKELLRKIGISSGQFYKAASTLE